MAQGLDISRLLFDRWRGAEQLLLHPETSENPVSIHALLAGVPKPGPAALRARFYALQDLSSGCDPQWFNLAWEQWQRQTGLVPLGEDAIAKRELGDAAGYFRELEALARVPGTHPVALIDALIGLGDVERSADNTAPAAEFYAEAERIARSSDLPFGRVRALVPWLLLQQRERATEDLLPAVGLCEKLATDLADDMYMGNSWLVRAEVLAVAGDLAGAVEAAGRAAELFGDHPRALPGLYVRLADAYRLARDPVGMRLPVLRALAALRRVDQPQEKSAALDLLAIARMGDRQWSSARVAAKAAIAVAEHAGDGRSAAHAASTLTQIERRSGDLEAALDVSSRVSSYFAGRDDSLGSASFSLIEGAELRAELGHPEEAAADARSALSSLEQLRCQQGSPSAQQEYRRRFAQVYRRSLELACRMSDPLLFVSTFEGLWGRRLAGLTGGDGPTLDGDIVLKTHVLAQAKLSGTATFEQGRERALRMLGRTALRGALPGMIEDQTNAAIAALSTPYDHALALSHLQAVPRGTAALLLAPVPEKPLRLAALLVDPAGNTTCDLYAIPPEVRDTLDNWRTHPVLTSVAALRPLLNLLPREIDDLPEGTPLLIVPLEEFWPIPWGAVSLADGSVLGARHPIRMSPSLALATVSRRRPEPEQLETFSWIGPGVCAHKLSGVPATPCHSAAEAVDRLLHGTDGQEVIIVAHGVPADGVGHFLHLGDGLTLTPLDTMRAHPPGRVALVSCWGSFVPVDQSGDPLTVATVLQARGASCVLATSAELSDDPYSAFFVDTVLGSGETHDWSLALHTAVRANISYPEFRQQLRRWAPLRVLGAW